MHPRHSHTCAVPCHTCPGCCHPILNQPSYYPLLSKDLIWGSFVALHHVILVACCVKLSQTLEKKRRPYPRHSNSHVRTLPFTHTQDKTVSRFSKAETLLECFFRVDGRENTCKDKVGIGGGLSVAAWVTLPYTWHGLPSNCMRNSVENLRIKRSREF